MPAFSSHSNPSRGKFISTILPAFLVGCLVGGMLARHRDTLHSSSKSDGTGPSHGFVAQLSDVPYRNTAHVDAAGRPVRKQQLLDPFVVPNFAGYSVATFRPGQDCGEHEHESLHEFFFVMEGRGNIQIGKVEHKVSPGTFLHVAPHERHNVWVEKDSPDGDMKMIVCGVAVD